MKLCQKIFVCYYRFQERLGNGDIPVFMSIGMILFAIYLYLTSISIVVSFYWDEIISRHRVFGLKYIMFYNIVICCLLGGLFYLKLIRGDRLKETLSIETTKSYKVGATVFVIGSIVCLFAAFSFMWAVNNGFIKG